MDRAQFEAFRPSQRRVDAIVWVIILGVTVACGLVIGYVWSFAVSIPLMIVLALLGFEVQLRYSRARWIKRFPELASPDTQWRRTRSQPSSPSTR